MFLSWRRPSPSTRSLMKAGLVSLCIAALLLDFEEELPGLGGDRLREVLDIVRTACGIYDLIEVRFGRQQLDVAGDLRISVGVSAGASDSVTSSERTPPITADMASVVPRSMFT